MSKVNIKKMLLQVGVLVAVGIGAYMFIQASGGNIIQEREVIQEQGWIYSGEGLIPADTYSQIQEELSTSSLKGHITVLEIKGSLVEVEYSFPSTTDYPNLWREKTTSSDKAMTEMGSILSVVGAAGSVLVVWVLMNTRKHNDTKKIMEENS